MITFLTVVVPVYNSETTLRELTARLHPVLADHAGEYEVILVNDGSRDRSWDVICDLAARHTWVRGISMMRNYGQHNALLCGIRAARGEIVVTMDDDLQHPPEEIPKLLGRLRSNDCDVVYGTPHALPHSLMRNLLSRFTKQVLARVMGIRSIRDISAFRGLRANLRQAFEGFHSPHLVLDVLLSWGTTRFAIVTVSHEPRRVGTSNYSSLRLINQVLLVLTGFSTAPLRLATLVGFGFTLLGALTLFYVVAHYFLSGSVPGFTFLASILSLFSGAQLFALGIIGEYLARIFNRSIERPTYVIGATIGGKNPVSEEEVVAATQQERKPEEDLDTQATR